MDKRNSKESLVKRIKYLEEKLDKVYDAGLSGISYVGTANYASRESEARTNLHNAMYKL